MVLHLEKATDLAYCLVMNFGMTDDSFLVKITNRPDFNNHIENQSIKKLKKFAKRLTMILLKFFYYFKLRIKRKNKN